MKRERLKIRMTRLGPIDATLWWYAQLNVTAARRGLREMRVARAWRACIRKRVDQLGGRW